MTTKAKFLVVAGALGLSGMVAALADDVQFVTLPETVRTAVIRRTDGSSASKPLVLPNQSIGRS